MITATLTSLDGRILAVFEEGQEPQFFSGTARELFEDGVDLADRVVEHGADDFFEALAARVAPMSTISLHLETEDELDL